MIELKSSCKFKVLDRGVAYVVNSPITFERGKCPFMNTEVSIDGQIRTVIGVESFAHAGPVSEGSMIGVLVKE